MAGFVKCWSRRLHSLQLEVKILLTVLILRIAMAVTSDEFWDYEKQVNLEAFSSSTFYDILLKHSVSVTTRLGQFKEEVNFP